jgi:hypothetical protein
MYPIENSGDLIKNKRRQVFSREMWGSVGSTVIFLGLTSLLTDISSEMVTATLPFYLLLTLRLAPLQFGLIDGLNQGASVLVRIASSLIADRWRRAKEVAAAGYAFSAVCRMGLLLVGRSWLGHSGVVPLDRILADKAVVMKATIKDLLGTVIATARKKETEIGFPDYIANAETGAIRRALAMCGYGTVQAPEFDEQDRLVDAPVEKAKNAN